MNVLSAMLYLTTPEEGGNTKFQGAFNGTGFEFKAKRGDLVLWWNCLKDGTHDFLSHHSSTPVRKGIKWNAVRFFQDEPSKCDMEPAATVKVPDHINKPQKTEDIPFGYELPVGQSPLLI